MMKKDRHEMLLQSQNVHIPLPIDETETAEYRLLRKPVLENRLLDGMESLEHWTAVTPHAKIELASDHSVCGKHSLKFTHPTNLEGWGNKSSHMYNPGRIYAVPAARRNFDGEDWTAWNRLSAWVYPMAPGMKSVTLRMQLFNDGVRKVPDEYLRDGAHNMSLKNGCWNHVVLEFPYLDRDCVTGVAFEYDMVGHEPEAVDHVTWYIDQLELQKVDCDVYEGWVPAQDRISFSGSGYQPGSPKTAIASGIDSDRFRLIETATGKVVLEKAIDIVETNAGNLQVMNFTEVMDEGEYLIVAGKLSTRVFSIRQDVWEDSVWKVLNFFFCLRCGYEVFGKHRACHSDMLLTHGDKAIVANGGWHDAGDLAQSFVNTSEGTMALFSLAQSLKGRNEPLFARVLEEAKWGLDYVMKMRFGDGYRGSYTSCSIWTDGVIGTHDDVSGKPVRSACTNFDAAYAEALGARTLCELDPDYANYALRLAREDFDFGLQIQKEIASFRLSNPNDHEIPQYVLGDTMEVQLGSLGVLAACQLWLLTGEASYRERALSFGRMVLDCQQQELTDWELPLCGFYYQDRERKLIWHHNHMSFAYLPDLALRALCETFPDDGEYMSWYAGLVRSGEYYRTIQRFTQPYGVIPAGVYHTDEAVDFPEKVLRNHPMVEKNVIDRYAGAVRKGIPLGGDYYLRVYPVWFSFRGNYNVLLSEGKSMCSAASVRNHYPLYAAAQQQYEWIVGKNPMCQSTLYGEGYDYVQLYACQPGQTVGALPVGMMSHFDRDEPYWPQVDNATYKEVWICPATKWMWCMADSLLPARVSGYLIPEKNAVLKFTHNISGKVFRITPHPDTGWFDLELPAGTYAMAYGRAFRSITVISGKNYRLDGALYALEVRTDSEGGTVRLTVEVQSDSDLPIEIRTDNLDGIPKEAVVSVQNGEGILSFTGTIQNPTKPFTGMVIPNGNLSDMTEFLDARLS